MSLKELIVECGAVRFGDFTLASGRKSSYYVDIKKASTNPVVLREVGAAMAPKAREYDYLAGMELGAVPVAVAASLASGVPFLMIRKKPKEYGTTSRIEGEFQAGKRVLVVEDVTTSGGSSLSAVEALREAGLAVDRVFTVVDRQEGAEALLEQAGVKLDALVTAKTLLEMKP